MDIVAEMRLWLTFLSALLAGYIGVRTYIEGQRQRRLENSLRMINMFYEGLQEGDLDGWKMIFLGASESSGAMPGHFVQMVDGEPQQVPLWFLFSEGSPDNGAVERMAEMFDLIANQALKGTIDLELVYFRLGQLMDTVHSWVNTVNLLDNYPRFKELYCRGLIGHSWPKQTILHIG